MIKIYKYYITFTDKEGCWDCVSKFWATKEKATDYANNKKLNQYKIVAIEI